MIKINGDCMFKITQDVEIDGKQIILRCPTLSDYKGMQKFYNQCINESLQGGGYLSGLRPWTLKEEKKWVTASIQKIKKRQMICLLAEEKGKIIGSATIEKETGATGHTATFGITILEEFTGKGLGAKLTETIIKLARKQMKTEIVKLWVYSNNKRAQGLYKKMGFKEAGIIKKGKKINGIYGDNILMVRHL